MMKSGHDGVKRNEDQKIDINIELAGETIHKVLNGKREVERETQYRKKNLILLNQLRLL